MHACCIADRDGHLIDSIQFNKQSALNGALKHHRDPAVLQDDVVQQADETIHMYPFKFAPECEVSMEFGVWGLAFTC